MNILFFIFDYKSRNIISMSFCSKAIILLGFIPIVVISVLCLCVIDFHTALSGSDNLLLWMLITSFVNIFLVMLIVNVFIFFSQKLLKISGVLFMVWLFVSSTFGCIYLVSNREHQDFILGVIMCIAQGFNIFFTMLILRIATYMS